MNILFLSELLYPHGSGAELATYLYANLLSKADFNVAAVTNRFAGESEFSQNGNLTIYRLPLFKGSSAVKYSILKRFDVLLSSFMRKMMKWADAVYVPRFWFSTIPLAKAYGKPVVVHLHDYISICPLSNNFDLTKNAVCDQKTSRKSLLCSPRCIYAYEKMQGRDLRETLSSILLNSSLGRYFPKFVKLSDAVICVSKTQKDIIAKQEPSLRDRTHLVYNPLPKISDAEIEGDDFGYFGGLNYLKGFRTLYQAMLKIDRTNRGTMRIHATKFPRCDTEFVKSLNALGFFLYVKLDAQSYEKLYRKLRAVLVPSLWHEPWPYVVVEAIIKRRFVVASITGGIPEQVAGCDGVALFNPGNYDDLANAIEFVNSLSRERIIDLCSGNKDTFLKRFCNEDTNNRFIDVYEHLR